MRCVKLSHALFAEIVREEKLGSFSNPNPLFEGIDPHLRP